jgi:hypothetical protein
VTIPARTLRVSVLSLALAATVVAQQAATRRATNVAALAAHPGFFHLRPVTAVGELKLQDTGEFRLTTDGVSMHVVVKDSAPEGLDEVRGEFWDVGRMGADDPRLAGMDLRRVFKIDPDAPWPRPGDVMAIIASAITAAEQPSAPTIRNVVLNPSRYLDQRITLTGQFGGRNLLGDLPDAPAQSRYDFVLRSADAAIWVTKMQPKGKDFELALDARIDTGRWLEVSGTLQQGRGLQWLEASPGSLKLTQAPKESPQESVIRVAAAPPPEVLFSAPIADETDVPRSTRVRVQFSRDIDPSTLRGHVAVKYQDAQPASPAEQATPSIDFTTQYLPGTRVLEIRFRDPLEGFHKVAVELGEGILGTDKQPLKPWNLTFQTGS